MLKGPLGVLVCLNLLKNCRSKLCKKRGSYDYSLMKCYNPLLDCLYRLFIIKYNLKICLHIVMYVFEPFEQNKLKNVKKCFCYPFSFQVCSNIEFQHFNIFSCAKRKWALYYLDYFSRGFYFFFTNQEFKFFTWTKFCETRFSVLNIAILENPNCAYKIARR